MSYQGYNSVFGWIEPRGLTAVTPYGPNHIMTFANQFGTECRNGPAPTDSVFLSNPLEITSQTDTGVDANSTVRAPVFSFTHGGAAEPAPLSNPDDPGALWLGPDTEPVIANRILYLGDRPVADGIGIRADEPEVEHIMLFKDTNGEFAYKGEGNQTEALLGQSLAIDGYFKVGEKTLVVPGAESGNVIYSEGDGPTDRINAGNFPIIRSVATAAAVSGGGLPTGKIAVFANSDGDIMPQLEKEAMDPDDPEYDPDYPDDKPDTEMEGPVEITNPNENPDKPALKVCQDTPTPTELSICNEGGGGGALTFPGSTPHERPRVQSTPATGNGLALMTPAVGGIIPPVAAIAIPPIPASSVAGVLAGGAASIASAAALASTLAGGAGAGAVAAAGAIAGAAMGAAGICAIGGVVGAPMVAFGLIDGGLPDFLPPGTISLHPDIPGLLLNGPYPIVTMEPTSPIPGTVLKVKNPDGEVMMTTETEEEPPNPYVITPILPGETVSFPSQITTFGSTTSGPTTIALTGPCDKKYTMTWDCTTETMTHKIVDEVASTETTVMTTTETSTDIPLVVTDGTTLIQRDTNPDSPNTMWFSNADSLRPMFGSNKLALYTDAETTDTSPIADNLVVYLDNEGNRGTPITTVQCGQPIYVDGSITTKDLIFTPQTTGTGLWVDETDLTRPKYGDEWLALASDISGAGLTTDTNPVINNMVVYADAAGNRKTADASVTLDSQQLILKTDGATFNKGLKFRPGATDADGVSMSVQASSSQALICWNCDLNLYTQLNPAKYAWQMSVSQSLTNDHFRIQCGTGFTTKTPLTIAAADAKVLIGSGGASVPFLEIRHDTSNKGSSTALWCESTTDSLRYADSNILTTASPSTADTIPVFSDTDGRVGTVSSSTAANLARPITITPPTVTGANSYGFTVNGTVNGFGRVFSQILNNATGNSSAGLLLGKPYVASTSLTWEFGVDRQLNNTDNFYIRHNKTGATPLTIDPDDMVTLSKGTSAPRYDIVSQSTNPGSTGTIWADSGASGALRYGAGNVLVDPAPTVANAIPVYTGVAGQVDTASSSSAANIGRPLTISPPTSTTNVYGFTVSGAVTGSGRVYSQILNNAPGNSSAALFLGKPFVGTSLTWEFGVDRQVNNTDNFYIRHNKTNTTPLIIGPDDLMVLSEGTIAPRYEFEPVASNPGSGAALWVSSTDNRLQYNDSPIVDVDLLTTLMGIEEWSGNWTISNIYFSPTSQTVPVYVTKVRNQVTVMIGSASGDLSFLPAGEDGLTPTEIYLTPDPAMPTSLLPFYDTSSYLSTVSLRDYKTEWGFLFKYDNANLRFQGLPFIGPGPNNLVTIRYGYFTYLSA